jgi:hypothetical protein
MPTLIPQLMAAELPDVVTERLNALLLEQGTQLLAARDGLVVAAESVRAAVGELTTPLHTNEDMRNQVQPGTAAAAVMEWLRREAPEEMATYGPVVEGDLQSQLCPYEDYEAGVLERINRSLNDAMIALDLESGPATTRTALSQICGRTTRDWTLQ